MGKLLRVNPRHSYHKKKYFYFSFIYLYEIMGVHWTYWGIISWCMEVKLLCWSAVCQLHLNKTESIKKEKLLQAAIKAPSQRFYWWAGPRQVSPLKKKKTIFIINILIFAYPSILQKEEREKKRKESKSDPTLDNGARQHLSVEHIIFSFWHAYGKR